MGEYRELVDEIELLKARLSDAVGKLEQATGLYVSEIQVLSDRLRIAEAKVERLGMYAKHDYHCSKKIAGDGFTCECGLDDALKGGTP